MAKQTNVLNERVYCYEHVKTKIIAHIPFGYARQYTNREKIGTGKFRRNCTFIDKKKNTTNWKNLKTGTQITGSR